MRRLTPVASKSSAGNRRGIVLVVVLVVVVMVAFAGFGFLATMSTEYEAVRLDGDQLQSEQTLASAEALMLWYVEQPRTARDATQNADPATMFRDVRLDAATGDELSVLDAGGKAPVPLREIADGVTGEDNAWQFTIVSYVSSGLSEGTGFSEVGGNSVQDRGAISGVVNLPPGVHFGPANESARLNLETLLEFDAAIPGSGRESLIRLTGMSSEAADSLLDWIDADSLPREFGAEADYYQRLPQPYQPRNGMPETVEELLFVKGIQRAALLGRDTNRNFVIDDAERRAGSDPLDTAPAIDQLSDPLSGLGVSPTDELPSGWSDLISLYSAQRNTDSFGNPRIDLNAGDLELLHETLSAILPQEVADFVILMRQSGPVAGPPNGADVSSVSVDLTLPSTYFLTAISDLIDQSVTVASDESFVTVASPLDMETESGREALRILLEQTSVTHEPLIRGRININAAPRRVLLAVPGWSESAVNRLISRRGTLDDEARATTAWLLEEDILTVDEFIKVQPWLTTGGDVFRCQVVAFRPLGGPTRRIEIVAGPTGSGTGRLFFRDLTVFGVGFPKSVLSSN